MSELRIPDAVWKFALPQGKKSLRFELFSARQWRPSWSPYKKSMHPTPPLQDAAYWRERYRLRIDGRWYGTSEKKYHFFTMEEVARLARSLIDNALKIKNILIVLMLCSSLVQAETRKLEPVGKVYPIAEPNIIDEMKQQAENHPTDSKAARDEYFRYQPKDLHKLPRAIEDRSAVIDMTHTLDHDLVDQQGRILYKKGFAFNPLNFSAFPGGLVIIDGSDREQVEWFTKSPYAENRRAILLISDGYAPLLRNELKRPVYYLTSQIAKRLRLQATPSIVVQEGKALALREVSIEKR